MESAIRPKVVTKGKHFNEFSRRYVFYPLQNLNFSGSQSECPLWSPKIPKGRFVLLEACEYLADEGASVDGMESARKSLTELTMGTDAQVKFLMGNAEGGYMEKGMTNLDSMVDVDPETAIEIERLILPTDKEGKVVVPENLIKFQAHLNSVKFTESTPITEMARKVLAEVKDGVQRGINYCQQHTSQMEQELADGQNGGFGMKFLTETNKYYFHQIEKPLPEDRQGTNMGSELAKVLAPLIKQAEGNAPPADSGEVLRASMELEATQKKLEAAEAALKEQAEVIETLTNEPEQPTAAE